MLDNSQKPDRDTYSDRLTTLMERFTLEVRPALAGDASLVIIGEVDRPVAVRFGRGAGTGAGQLVLFAVNVEWGGGQNPLLAALPDTVEMQVSDDPDSLGLIQLIQSEAAAPRCGGGSVLSRLTEVLIVRMLRQQIAQGATTSGLLAGLADPRLSRAIVAIHDAPGQGWNSAALAEVAGLSLSRFSDLFQAHVGEPPMAYLRRWRMTVARQDIERGDRISTVARRYGYTSAEAFTRAFRKAHGTAPIALRHGSDTD